MCFGPPCYGHALNYLPFCLFCHTCDTFFTYNEKAKFVCFIDMQQKKIHICSNKHETCLVVVWKYPLNCTVGAFKTRLRKVTYTQV